MSIKKPNAMHIRDGTARTDRGTDVEVPLTDELSKEPVLQDFGKKIDKKQIFKQVRAWVIQMTGSCKIDELSISMLVDQFEIYAISKRDINERGTMLVGDKGQYVNHSLYNMNTAHDKIVKLMKEFGMTPATRGSVKASNQMDKDPLEDILNGP